MAEKFSRGYSNPTFLLKAVSSQYVLRRQPLGQLLKSAHAVGREYRVLMALADTPVPVARAYHLCEDCEVIGSLFYVMSFEQGSIFEDQSLTEIDQSLRGAYYEELIRVLAAIHDVDVNAVGLGGYGRPGNYYQRQISLWTMQYRASETDRIDAMEALIEWLPANSPADDRQMSLMHGDYRLENTMFTSGASRALAVLDWELSTLGHPQADLAYLCMCMCMRLSSDEQPPG